MRDNKLEFPEGFIWGTSVCSHQAEGYNEHSDWWHWEQQGKIDDGTVSGPAADMLNRYPEDFKYMQDLGLGAFRLGIEWSRIEPQRGRFDEKALEHYDRVFEEMKKCGLKVCLTLYHWVLPKWVADAGGWNNNDIVRWFRRFCRKVIDRYYDHVDIWVTLNEPMVPVIAGHLVGVFPPERKSLLEARRVSKNLLKAHLEAYTLINMKSKEKGDSREPLIGIAQALAFFESPKPDNIFGEKFADFLTHSHNMAFLDALDTGRIPPPFGFNEAIHGLAGSYTFIGANYYTRMRFQLPKKFPPEHQKDLYYLPDGTETTEMGYEVYPPGFYNVLMDLKRYGAPIFITENGIADETDAQRPAYIIRHLAQVRRAIDDGADIRGYFYWSYIDNFEWKEGFAMHFGLVGLEPETLNRLPRPSAAMYGDIAKANAIDREMTEKFAPDYLDEIWGPE